MNRQQEYPDTPTSPEMVSALAELARLAQEILVASAPDIIEVGAAALLKRLLHFCGMHDGALLLSTHYYAASKSFFWRSLSERKMVRVLSRDGIDEQNLFALLATCSDNEEDIQVLLSEPGWVICQQLLPLPTALHQEVQTLAEPFSAPLSSTQSFFVLGGMQTTDLQSRQEPIEHVQETWPLLADAVGTVIISLLQAEKMYDLEMETGHRDLQQMELLKAELLASVSHELRSPLASIRGYAATLLRHERRIVREERHEFLLAIHDASLRLEVVIDRLLEMSQLETTTFPLKRVPVNPVYLAREAILAREQRLEETDASGSESAQMHRHVSQAKWTFVLHVEDRHGNPTDAILLLQADRRLLREALDHLLENAVLYSPEGGRIDVGLRTKEADEVYLLSQKLAQTSVGHRRSVVFPSLESEYQPMVEIWIQDHGIGIADPHLEQIFQRFYRVDTSLTREVNGLGIGLAICKQVVELHGGLLWVESEVGTGSTFHMLLPMNEQVVPML
ncbi:MAG: hypothetical protein JO215_00095 [Ktedonobacteraceae bacterium]|nr:hypothetical protein [Ktedonobacteraceae bacterium]